MTNIPHRELIIIGSGPAGYSAAIYAARANIKPMLITGISIGGQLATTTNVSNWPGYAEGVHGQELMERMRNHAERFDTEVINDHIHSTLLTNRPLILRGNSSTYSCDALIVATGASAFNLGLDSEAKFYGKGVSICATCDGLFFRDKDVIVVGGGNTAVEEALYLSNIASHVTLVHRRDLLRAENILQHKLFDKVRNGQVSIMWNHQVENVLGNAAGMTGVLVRSVNDGAILKLSASGLFVAIGHKPNTEILSGQLAMQNCYIVTSGTQTSVCGVFAAGDVADSLYRQAITAAASGCMAALDMQR